MPGVSSARQSYLRSTRNSINPNKPVTFKALVKSGYTPTSLPPNLQAQMPQEAPPADLRGLAALFGGGTPDYVTKYRQSLAASRQQIQQQFDVALGDLASREQLSQGVTQQLPGRYNAIYGGAGAQIDKDTAASAAAQAATGLQSYAPAGTGDVSEQKNAMTAAAASRQADVPLIAAGVTSQANRQRGALNQARLSASSDLDQQAAEAELGIGQQQEARRQSLQDALMQRQWSVEDQAQQSAADREARLEDRKGGREDALWQYQMQQKQDRQAQHQQDQATLRSFVPSDTSVDRALALREAQPKRYSKITSSKAYQDAERRQNNAVTEAGGSWVNYLNPFADSPRHKVKLTKKQVVARLKKQGLYRTAAAYRANH